MGNGAWTTDTYAARAASKARAGKSTFDYSDTLRRTPRASWKVHEDLDPLKVNLNGPNTGRNIREACDSEEHPDSVPVAVLFDVTGSMGHIPQVLQKKLPALHGLLMRKGYVEDPQILFGAIGDAWCDRVPLQVGQFESDNRMDEQLESIVLEGGGGGQQTESYELAMYFMARHTDLDCTRRGKKGYLFLMGDEMPYGKVSRRQVKELIGDDLEADIETAEIVAELEQKYEVFFLFVADGAYPEEQILPAWRNLLGERALVLDDAEAVSETIALTLGLLEGKADLEEAGATLKDAGADEKAVAVAAKALQPALAG